MAHKEFDRSELPDAVRAGGDIDVIRRSVEMVLQALIDAEATEMIGAHPHERTDTRTNQRNGSRPRLLARPLSPGSRNGSGRCMPAGCWPLRWAEV